MRCARRDCERKNAQNGVSRAGNVEDLASGGATLDAGLADTRVSNFKTCGRNMHCTRRGFFKNAHALFTARDDNRGTAEMRQQGAARFFNGFFSA